MPGRDQKRCPIEGARRMTQKSLQEARPWFIGVGSYIKDVEVRSLHDHAKVHLFPSVDLRPIEGKKDYRLGRQVVRKQICDIHPQARVPGLRVVNSVPVVDTPTNHRRGKDFQSESLPSRQCPAFVVEAPDSVRRAYLFQLIALHGLGGLIKDPAIPQRTTQLYVFGVGP